MMHLIYHQAFYCLAHPLLEVNRRHEASLFDEASSVMHRASTVQHVTQTANDITDEIGDDNPHSPYESYEDWLEAIEAPWEPDIDFYTNHNTQVTP